MRFTINSPCPCGSGKKYKRCCRVFHKGAYPKDVLTLMKSRFTAFAVGDINYIAKTAINQNDKDELKEFSRNCDFKSLEILDYGEDFVTFKATIFCQGQESSFIEKSYFKKVNGKWLYERGEFL